MARLGPGKNRFTGRGGSRPAERQQFGPKEADDEAGKRRKPKMLPPEPNYSSTELARGGYNRPPIRNIDQDERCARILSSSGSFVACYSESGWAERQDAGLGPKRVCRMCPVHRRRGRPPRGASPCRSACRHHHRIGRSAPAPRGFARSSTIGLKRAIRIAA